MYALFIGLSLSLTGCGGSDKTEKTKNDKVTERQSEKSEEQKNDVTLKRMSKEKTKTLKEGQFIDKINGQTLQIPDEETLEKTGLCYEVEVNDFSWSDGNEKNPEKRKAYLENANNFIKTKLDTKKIDELLKQALIYKTLKRGDKLDF